MSKIFKPGVAGSILLSSLLFGNTAFAVLVGCDEVAKKSGLGYEVRNHWAASLQAPEALPVELKLRLIERNGAWYVYETEQDWFERETCGDLSKLDENAKSLAFAPVLWSRDSGKSAVIDGTFLIKTHQESDLEKVAAEFGMTLLNRMPSGSSAIFDARPQVSYDHLLEQLARHIRIVTAVPLLAEQRYEMR